MIKKSFFLLLFAMAFAAGFSQNSDPDYFEVGPYEVDYYGVGDYHAQLKKGIDLYKYFNLKKDTVINVTKAATEPVKHAFQLSAFMSLPRYVVNGASNVWGLEGVWKMRLSDQMYFNVGLMGSVRMGEYHKHSYMPNAADKNLSLVRYDNDFKETIIEAGVPVSIEFSKVDRKKASLYLGIGVVPTFYTGAKGEHGDEIVAYDENGSFYMTDVKTQSGIYVAPRLEIGGYVPVGGKLVRIGGFYQNNLDCSGDFEVYKNRVGRSHLGASIGLVF